VRFFKCIKIYDIQSRLRKLVGFISADGINVSTSFSQHCVSKELFALNFMWTLNTLWKQDIESLDQYEKTNFVFNFSTYKPRSIQLFSVINYLCHICHLTRSHLSKKKEEENKFEDDALIGIIPWRLNQPPTNTNFKAEDDARNHLTSCWKLLNSVKF
jgi:hypothetical protein